ncbi:PREDICTED: cytochrome b5 type B-like [Ceratosolen solmsi marchali]|uniref:Cytochrome b5 type B-like n=1 Tax=Ceratosolen solmsi marchali TaxID=326594 RepID=A0AAJ6YMG6_9HYME|nr:PREDICTED: cytochrome b5 type B-like [Ceratosolen solmsi marchali]
MVGYTLEEVARHNGRIEPRCWIIVRGVVYDVTDFMAEHPGGAELIAERAGTDATSAFEDLGHSSDAKKILKKYEIGWLAETGGRESSEEAPTSDLAVAEGVPIKKSNWRQRRKFLSMILGPCAST